MMRWESIPGKATGFAVFNHGRKREWRLPLASAADFDMLQREFEHQGNQKVAVIYWDVVNEVRQLAEKRTKAVVSAQKEESAPAKKCATCNYGDADPDFNTLVPCGMCDVNTLSCWKQKEVSA